MPRSRDTNGNIVSIDEKYFVPYLILGLLAPIVIVGLAIMWIGKQLDTLFWKILK